MMTKLNLILLSITAIFFICVAMYFYRTNKSTLEPFYQETTDNTIMVGDIATKVVEGLSYVYVNFPGTLAGTLSNTPEVNFNDKKMSSAQLAIANVVLPGPSLTHELDSKLYANNARANEKSYVFSFNNLPDGNYKFDVSVTGQNKSTSMATALNLYIEQLGDTSGTTNIYAGSRCSIAPNSSYGTCAVNLTRSLINANLGSKPLRIRITANPNIDTRILNLSISVVKID